MAMTYNWSGNKLLWGKKDTGLSIVPSETEGMWRIKFSDGKLSIDHYNKTRAKDHAIYLDGKEKLC